MTTTSEKLDQILAIATEARDHAAEARDVVWWIWDKLNSAPVEPSSPVTPPPPSPPPAPVDKLKAAFDALAVHHTEGMSFDDAAAFLFKAITSQTLAVVADEAAIEIAYKWPDQWHGLRQSVKGYIEGVLRAKGIG